LLLTIHIALNQTGQATALKETNRAVKNYEMKIMMIKIKNKN